MNVYRYGEADHYTGSYRWRSFNKNEVDSAAQGLDLIREFAAKSHSITANEIQFTIAKSSLKKLNDLAKPAFDEIDLNGGSKKRRFAKKVIKQEVITESEIEIANDSLYVDDRTTVVLLESNGRGINIKNNLDNKIVGTITKYSEEVTDIVK